MKKINNSNRGSSFLEKLFPFHDVDNDDITKEDARIAAAAAATAASEKNIDNNNSSNKKEDTNTKSNNGNNTTGGGINIGTVNGGIHFHFGDNGTHTSHSHSDDDDNIIDADFVDVTDASNTTRQQQKPVQTPRLTQTKQQPRPVQTQQTQQTQQSQQYSKRELTKLIRTGNTAGYYALDRMILECNKTGNMTELVELFQDNKAMCFWIKRDTQYTRWSQLPVLVQELINQQVQNI